MSRSFNGTNQYFSLPNVVTNTKPWAMACWFQVATLTANYTILSQGNSGAATGFYRTRFAGATANDPFSGTQQSDAGVNGTSTQNTAITANTWHHGGANFIANNSRTNYFDGVASASNVTNIAAPTPDFAAIGCLLTSTASDFLSGLVAEVAWWTGTLTADDWAMLAAGFAPSMVKPQNLLAYAPLFGRATDEEDLVMGSVWTNNGSSPAAEHPPFMIYPEPQNLILLESTAPGAFNAAWNASANSIIQSGAISA